MDWLLLRVIGVVLLGTAGLAYAGLATRHYLFAERGQMNGVPVAFAALALAYGLAYSLTFSAIQVVRLLPTILTFWIAIAVVIAIRIGVKARSKAGYRIAFAGMFTLVAYFLLTARAAFAH